MIFIYGSVLESNAWVRPRTRDNAQRSSLAYVDDWRAGTRGSNRSLRYKDNCPATSESLSDPAKIFSGIRSNTVSSTTTKGLSGVGYFPALKRYHEYRQAQRQQGCTVTFVVSKDVIAIRIANYRQIYRKGLDIEMTRRGLHGKSFFQQLCHTSTLFLSRDACLLRDKRVFLRQQVREEIGS